MIQSVRIRNFQSLHNVDLALGKLTAIVGSTDVGKSAFIRAVTAAVDNRRGSSFLLDGTEFCNVELVLKKDNDEWVVGWTKPKKNSGYYYRRLANSLEDATVDPEFYAAFTGLKVLSFAKGYFVCKPNFHQQKEDDFLLSASDNFKSKVLGEITNAALILLANSQIKKDAAQNSNLLNYTMQDHAEVCLQLSTKFVGLDELKQDYEQLLVLERQIKELQTELFGLETMATTLKSAIAEHNRAMAIAQYLHREIEPVLVKTKSQITWIDENLRFKAELVTFRNRILYERDVAQKAVDYQKLVSKLPLLGDIELRVTDLHSLMGYREIAAQLDLVISTDPRPNFAGKLAELDAELSAMREQVDICPFCDTVLTGRHQHENSSNQ